MTNVFLGLGSNITPRRKHIQRCVDKIKKISGVLVENVSHLYETDPVGGPKQGAFLNAAVHISTDLSPQALLVAFRRIEQLLKRRRRVKWGPRTIDIDILTYGNTTLKSPTLRIPHPRYHTRRFVLIPLADIAPTLRHPVFKTSTKTLLRQLTPQGQRVTMRARWKKSQFVLSKRKKRTKSP
jgi:2-amino-4-hydroxy-6-hydroxymethyldihydropteridine diphosphokinase